MPNTRRRTSEQDRARLVECFEDGEDFVSLALTLGIKRTTAYSIVGTYVKEGRVGTLSHGGGRQNIIDDETMDFLVLLLGSNCLLTLKELKDTVRSVWPEKPHFSEVTLSRTLDGELISLKLTRDSPSERNSDRVLGMRRDYAQWMLAEGMNQDRIYIDECGFNIWTRRNYGRAKVGDRVIHGQRGRNANVICAISNRCGILYHEVHFGAVNKERFSSFMRTIELLLEGSNCVIIMDNAPIYGRMDEIYPELS